MSWPHLRHSLTWWLRLSSNLGLPSAELGLAHCTEQSGALCQRMDLDLDCEVGLLESNDN